MKIDIKNLTERVPGTGDFIQVDQDRCIGCGHCVPVCTTEAIKLVKNTEQIVPPNTKEDLLKKISAKKNQLIQQN